MNPEPMVHASRSGSKFNLGFMGLMIMACVLVLTNTFCFLNWMGSRQQAHVRQLLIDQVMTVVVLEGCEPVNSQGSDWCGLKIREINGEMRYVVFDDENNTMYMYEPSSDNGRLVFVGAADSY